MSSIMKRRKFLKQAGVLAGAATLPSGTIAASKANSAVTLGLIGCGGRGNWISKIFEDKTNSKIVAVSDALEDRLATAAKNFKVPENRRYKGLLGYKDLVESDLEGVVIISPPYCHPEQGKDAVEAGKHVYMAKPVAVDVPGCKLVAKYSEKAKGKVSYWVDFQTRANETYQEAVRRTLKGAIGRPVSGQVYYYAGRLGKSFKKGDSPKERRIRNWAFDIALSGDIIVEQNIHVIDVCNWLLGSRPVAAYGTGGRKARVDVGDCWDHFLVTYYYPGHVHIDFSSGQFCKGYSDLCARIYGSGGTVDTHYSGKVEIKGDESWPGKSTSGLYYSGALNNVRRIVTSIESGKLIHNGEEAAQSTQTCVLGREAAYAGKELTWEEVEKEGRKLDPALL